MTMGTLHNIIQKCYSKFHELCYLVEYILHIDNIFDTWNRFQNNIVNAKFGEITHYAIVCVFQETSAR